MSERILIGMLTGVILVTTVGFRRSKYFSKRQKILLIICIVFPPAQWVFAIIYLYI